MSRTAIGSLRHRVAIEQPIRVAAGGGAAEIEWQPVATVFASITPKSGGETLAGDKLGGETTHVVRFRWRQGIDSTMRLSHAGRTFAIRSVIDEGERRRWLVCACQEFTS